MYNGSNEEIAEHIQSEFCFKKDPDEGFPPSEVRAGSKYDFERSGGSEKGDFDVSEEAYGVFAELMGRDTNKVGGFSDQDEMRTDGGTAVGSHNSTDYGFQTDPTDKQWWKEGEKEFPYRDEMDAMDISVIYDSDPNVIGEDDYLSADELEAVRVMVEETEIDEEGFIDDIYQTEVHPVHKNQIRQVLEDPTSYAVDGMDPDGYPIDRGADLSPEVTEEARDEYIHSRGSVPGTSIDTTVRDNSVEEDGQNSRGMMGI